jgi:hypothetical protein
MCWMEELLYLRPASNTRHAANFSSALLKWSTLRRKGVVEASNYAQRRDAIGTRQGTQNINGVRVSMGGNAYAYVRLTGQS